MAIDPNFELIDRYLLEGKPAKAAVVEKLLASPADTAGAAAFYEGMRLLGPRTPDIALIALRLVLAGRHADDASVVRVRALSERARGGDADAKAEYVDAVG